MGDLCTECHEQLAGSSGLCLDCLEWFALSDAGGRGDGGIVAPEDRELVDALLPGRTDRVIAW